MLEHEYKYTATKENIEQIRSILKDNKSVISIERGVQINYYYDTENLDFQSRGITIRIRHKESGLKLQIKKKNYYGEHKNLETETEMEHIPSTLIVEGKEVALKGHLVTDRTRHIFNNGIKLDLDINFYCDTIDYEVEIELPEGKKDIEDVLSLVWKLKPAKLGKATRFYNAKFVSGDN